MRQGVEEVINRLTAIILAGGKGSRLEPWHAPKCLMPINGVPIIKRLVDHIARHAEKIIICVGYRADDVMRALGTSYAYSNAGEDATMCARLIKARTVYDVKGDVLVLYGDELADVDIDALRAHHAARQVAASVTAFRQLVPFGAILSDDGILFGIDEQMHIAINIGFAILGSEAMTLMRPEQDFSGFLTSLARTGSRVAIYEHTGKRSTINGPQDIANAEEIWR